MRMNHQIAVKKKILMIQPMIGIGDLIWVKPWIDEAITRHEVIFMSKPSACAATILSEHPGLRMISLCRSQRGKTGKHDGILGFIRLWLDVRKVNPDEIWILHKSWRYAAVGWLARVRKRYGYGMGKQSLFLSGPNLFQRKDNGIHPREAVRLFMSKRGIELSNDHPKITVNSVSVETAKKLVPKNREVLFIGVGATTADRRWSLDNFALLVEKIADEFPLSVFVLCGSSNETQYGQYIKEKLRAYEQRVILVFDQPLDTVIGIAKISKLYIGNDTSLLNIAAAVDLNCIRIYASKLPVLNSERIFCVNSMNSKKESLKVNINDITPQQVFNCVRKLLIINN